MLHWMMGALESKWLKTTILDFPRGGKNSLIQSLSLFAGIGLSGWSVFKGVSNLLR